MPQLKDYAAYDFRDDIQGVRALGAILIMIYHIWLQKVSGGVDVFFVISGYLMAGVILREAHKKGTINPFSFYLRIAARIFPAAYTVLFITLCLSAVFIPSSLWLSQVIEIIASALQAENLQLMRVSADYLNRDNPPSVVQQYWALSIQIQFYIVLPFLMIVLVKLINIKRQALQLLFAYF